jgi:hypothetical protein
MKSDDFGYMWIHPAGHYGVQLNRRTLSQSRLAPDRVGATETLKYFVCCVLDADTRFMQLAGSPRSEPGEEIPIGDVSHRAKNEIRSHENLRMN